MAKAKFLPLLTRGTSCLKRSGSKKYVATTAPASSESDSTKSQELLLLLNNLPESDRELSFSFLVSNGSPEKDSATEEQRKEVKEKRKRKISRSSTGVLLNLNVPVPFTDYNRSRSGHRTPCTTLAELEKRETEISQVGCWSALLRRKPDNPQMQLDVIPQFTY